MALVLYVAVLAGMIWIFPQWRADRTVDLVWAAATAAIGAACWLMVGHFLRPEPVTPGAAAVLAFAVGTFTRLRFWQILGWTYGHGLVDPDSLPIPPPDQRRARAWRRAHGFSGHAVAARAPAPRPQAPIPPAGDEPAGQALVPVKRPAKIQSTAEPWDMVLGVDRKASMVTIERAFKTRAKALHPDAGGDPVEMQRLLAALEDARRARAT